MTRRSLRDRNRAAIALDPDTPDLEEATRAASDPDHLQPDLFQGQEDAPPCSSCGFVMVRSGSCYKCQNCGATSGCS